MGRTTGKSKRQREHKTSTGTHGGGGKVRPRLSEVQKVLLGKGMIDNG